MFWPRQAVRGLAIHRHLDAGTPTVGEAFEETFEISKPGRVPAPWVEVEDLSRIPDYQPGRVVSLGRDPESGTRKYHNKTIRGSFREAQTYLSGKLQEREIGRLPLAAAISLNQYLDQWLTTAAKPRLR